MLNPTREYKANTFHCPHCGVYTKQKWRNVAKGVISDNELGFYEGFIPDLYLSFCSKCGDYALWLNDKLIYPALSTAPWPAENMPESVKEDFLEARDIVFASPKAACALLRLALKKLMIVLGEHGKSLDSDVSSLVKKGLPRKFRDGLRAAKVIGAKAVQPGELSNLDDAETAVSLFNLVNLLVEAIIWRRRRVNQTYIVFSTSKPLRRRPKRRKVGKPKKNEVIPKPTLLYR